MPTKYTNAQKVTIIITLITVMGGLATVLFTNVLAGEKKKAPPPWIEVHKDLQALTETVRMGFSAMNDTLRRNSLNNQREHIQIRRSIDEKTANIGSREDRFEGD